MLLENGILYYGYCKTLHANLFDFMVNKSMPIVGLTHKVCHFLITAGHRMW